jgi:hypothetical protein
MVYFSPSSSLSLSSPVSILLPQTPLTTFFGEKFNPPEIAFPTVSSPQVVLENSSAIIKPRDEIKTTRNMPTHNSFKADTGLKCLNGLSGN